MKYFTNKYWLQIIKWDQLPIQKCCRADQYDNTHESHHYDSNHEDTNHKITDTGKWLKFCFKSAILHFRLMLIFAPRKVKL